MILLNVHKHLLVVSPYRISLMHGRGLFETAKQVCHPFDRKLLRPTYMYACTHIHVNNLPPE